MPRVSSAFALLVLLAVALVAAMSFVAHFFGTLYYDAIDRYFSGYFLAENTWTWIDWGFLALMLAFGIPIAVLLSWTLARRMAAPMTEVARAVRSVAAGDLSARAASAPNVYSEMKGLAEDFNRLAERLERSEAEMRFANAAIAHELRTPLTILKGRLQGVTDGVFEMTPDMVTALMAQVDGLARIFEDLRLLTLLEPGRVPINRQPVDLADLARQTVTLVGDDLTEAGMEVVLVLSPVTILADPVRLRQALLALLTNAIRHAPGEALSVSVRQERSEAFLVVADGGPGMPSEGLERAFDPFWRGEKSRCRNTGGSGLGLAVVRAIVQAHGGAVQVRNYPAGGCEFTLCLPNGGAERAGQGAL